MRLAYIFFFIPLLSFAQQKGQQLKFPSGSVHNAPPLIIHPLSVGDILPAAVLNAKLQTLNAKPVGLSSPVGGGREGDRGVLILDFWASWCTSCLHSFSKLDSLEQTFGGQLHVVLVNEKGTADKEQTVEAYFNRHRKKDGSKYAFASILYDTVLAKYFPHQLLPHYVWLDSDLKVLAITSAEELTATNIRSFLDGKGASLPLKTDKAAYDVSLPLLHNANGVSWSSVTFQSVLTPRLPGFGTFGKKWSDGVSQKITWVNHSLINLYQFAFSFNANRLVIDSLLLDSLSSQYASYELIAPASLSKQQLNAIFAQDLNRYLGLDGRWQKQLMHCFVLQRSSAFDSSLLQTKGGTPKLRWLGPKDSVSLIINQPLSKMVEALNTSLIGSKKTIIMDETGFNPNVDMVLRAGLKDGEALKTELAKYGLDLIPAQRELDVFILTRNTAKQDNNPTQ